MNIVRPLSSLLLIFSLSLTLSSCSAVDLQPVVGSVGPSGETGHAGPQGAQGLQGQQGVQGPTGSKGDTGAEGPTGQNGLQGSIGANGASGSAGAIGPAGAQGPPGPAGVSAIVGYDFRGSLTQSPTPVADYGSDSYMGSVGLPTNGDYQLTIRVESDRPIRCTTVGGQFYGPNILGREFFYSQLQSIPNPDVYLVHDIQVLWTSGSEEIVKLYCQSVDPGHYDATVSRALFIATKIG
jgi:hypothetical protein